MVNPHIHPTAYVDQRAELADNVIIGPYSLIGPDVVIGAGTQIGSHSIIQQNTRIGCDNFIGDHVHLGGDPLHTQYKGEPTFLEIGDRNTIREYSTMHRGSQAGEGKTKVGNDNLFMLYTHVSHDSIVGNHVMFINNATTAGHVHIQDYVYMGAFCAIRQFCQIGAHSYLTNGAKVTKDVLPYMMVTGIPAAVIGLNSRGLKARGFSTEELMLLKRAFKLIYMRGHSVGQAIMHLSEWTDCQPIHHLVNALQTATRGIVRPIFTRRGTADV